MNEEQVIEIIRLAYLSALSDHDNDCEQLCEEGSRERATELLEEFESDRLLGFQIISK